MSSYFLAPGFLQVTQFVPGGNTVANGGQLFFYQSGSSTKANVYKDNAGNTAWTNPLVLDSGGNLPNGGEIWFTGGVTYKAVFAPATDTDPPASPYWTRDDLSGINDVSSAESEWLSGPAPTFVSSTSFTLVGDQTATFTVGRRLKTTNTGGTIYSTIVASAFTTLTTVTVVSDSGTLDSGLSAVSYALLDPANPGIAPAMINRKGANVASAGNGTTSIWGTVGDFLHVTGTNTIYSFSTAPYAGAMRELIFDNALSLMSSASLAIPGNRNISTTANDRLMVRADTVSTHIITRWTRAGVSPAGLQPVQKIITSTGTYTPTFGMVYATVEILGGGGGGGGTSSGVFAGAAGGGSGGYCCSTFSAATIGASTAVTIGDAGSGGAAGPNSGNNGSTTSFGGFMSAGGGVGGSNGTSGGAVGGGAGGSASAGTINVLGDPGGSGWGGTATVPTKGGKGGNSQYGHGGAEVVLFSTGGNGNPSTGFGAGGGGASNPNAGTNRAGGNGSAGVAIITEYVL